MKLAEKLIGILLLGCSSMQVSAQESVLHFKNLLPAERKDELIQLDRSLIEKRMKRKIQRNEVVLKNQGVPLTLQYDDLDADGQWDKLVFLLSFKPNESVDLKLGVSVNDPMSVITRAHVRQKRKHADDSFGPALETDSVPAGQPNTDFSKASLPPFLTEGPAWENDKAGFRIYMDVRNTVDLWGKTTPAMMMDTVGVDPKVIYHHLAPWGMDILAVGKSLGAGSLAMNVPIPGKADTLVRLGGVNMGKINYRKISDGPVRAVFIMEYPEWNVLGDGKLTSVTEQISIWGGQYFYESKVSLKNAPAGAKLVTGIVNLKSSKAWKDNNNRAMFLSTFDKQSENNDNLGMAVMLDKADFISFGQTPNKGSEVLNTYTVAMKVPSAGKSVAYRFYSCWERSDPMFSSEKEFKLYLFRETAAYSSPIQIK